MFKAFKTALPSILIAIWESIPLGLFSSASSFQTVSLYFCSAMLTEVQPSGREQDKMMMLREEARCLREELEAERFKGSWRRLLGR